MKRFIKIIAVSLIFCLTCNIPILAHENSDIIEEINLRIEDVSAQNDAFVKEIIQKEAPAQAQYEDLISYLDFSAKASNENQTSNNLDLNDYYGGAFLNDEKKLTICTTNNSPKIVSLFKKATGSDDIIIQQVDYTKSELDSVAESFRNMLDQYRRCTYLTQKQFILIQSIIEDYADLFTNRFVVGIHELNIEKITLFWNMFDLPSEIVRFESVEQTEEFVTISPGGALYLNANDSATNYNQSIGYRGYRIGSGANTIYGFTGCGHGAVNGIYKNGTLAGVRFGSRCGGIYDIAFYDAQSGVTLTNRTSYSDDSGNATDVVQLSIQDPPSNNNILLGSTVMKVGASTFYTSGQITNCNANATLSEGTGTRSYTDLFRTSARARKGDSGGTAFILYQGTYRIIGTITGGSVEHGYTYISKYLNAYYALGTVIYRY